MTDISGLRKDDRIVFNDGHESRVLEMDDDGIHSMVSFINRLGKKQSLYFLNETGHAPGTEYDIVKVLKHA